MLQNVYDIMENMELLYRLFPEGWQAKARELGALTRSRNIKTEEDLLMLILMYQTSGKSLGGTSALLKSSGKINLDKNAVYFRIQKSTKRLCIYRKTSEQAESVERQIKKSHKKKGRTEPSYEQLYYGNYVIVATSLSYSVDRVLELYRQRWQIEILFKRLKSLFDYDDMPARTETTMRAFISGKLLLAGICEVLVMQGRFPPPAM